MASQYDFDTAEYPPLLRELWSKNPHAEEVASGAGDVGDDTLDLSETQYYVTGPGAVTEARQQYIRDLELPELEGVVPEAAQAEDEPLEDVTWTPPFTVEEVLTREFTLTFSEELVPVRTLLDGFSEIATEAASDGAYENIVATVNGEGRVVLHYSSENSYEK